MKSTIIVAASLLFTPMLFAAQCRIDIDNDVNVSAEHLEIVESDGSRLAIASDNSVTLRGESLQLSPEQQQAMEDYKQRLADYGPKVKKLTDDGLALALDIVDDIAASIDAPTAFDDLKTAMTDYFSGLQARYYNQGDFTIPATSFDEFIAQWDVEMDQAKALFTSEFFEDAFAAMSEKMDQDGGLNLTQMADDMAKLKAKLEQRFREHANQLKQDKDGLCEELEGLKQQEQELHRKIPELENYRVFTI
ncbi:DUF2884 family protein [Vibrio astriarenae]|jgi:hypothetical protein